MACGADCPPAERLQSTTAASPRQMAASGVQPSGSATTSPIHISPSGMAMRQVITSYCGTFPILSPAPATVADPLGPSHGVGDWAPHPHCCGSRARSKVLNLVATISASGLMCSAVVASLLQPGQ